MLSLFATSMPFTKDESTQWVVLAAGVLATLYVIMRPRMRGRKVDPLARQPSAMGLAQQRQVERDIGNLMVEMLETARQMTAQLDTRATKLDLLIRQADQRLEALKSAGIAAPGTASVASAPSRTDSEAHTSTDANERPDAPAVSPPGTTPLPTETPPDPRHAEIYAMADLGRSPHDIARSLDRPNGEVELILALRRR
jgi:type II secretory pathway pseudopilin PulG